MATNCDANLSDSAEFFEEFLAVDGNPVKLGYSAVEDIALRGVRCLCFFG